MFTFKYYLYIYIGKEKIIPWEKKGVRVCCSCSTCLNPAEHMHHLNLKAQLKLALNIGTISEIFWFFPLSGYRQSDPRSESMFYQSCKISSRAFTESTPHEFPLDTSHSSANHDKKLIIQALIQQSCA